jgi:hypothetical protein
MLTIVASSFQCFTLALLCWYTLVTRYQDQLRLIYSELHQPHRFEVNEFSTERSHWNVATSQQLQQGYGGSLSIQYWYPATNIFHWSRASIKPWKERASIASLLDCPGKATQSGCDGSPPGSTHCFLSNLHLNRTWTLKPMIPINTTNSCVTRHINSWHDGGSESPKC